MTEEKEETGDGPPPYPAGTEDAWLAENIRDTRERTEPKMSQGELARRMEALGWPWWQQTVRRVEEGSRKLTPGEASAVARILGTSLARLMMPGREASAIDLLDRGTGAVIDAHEQIAGWTESLAGAQENLARSVAETEAAGLGASAPLSGPLREARDALGLTAESAVELGRKDGEADR